MKKTIILIMIGLMTILLLNLGMYAYDFFFVSITEAQLNVESGEVLVNGQIAIGNVQLHQHDTIQTKNGLGTIILYESIFISLQQNTTITLDDLTRKNPQIKQKTGTTWNKLIHLTGIDQFSISTSTTVASVRGTAFELSENKIITGEGEVEYSIENRKFIVLAPGVVEKKDGKINTRSATTEEINTIKKNFERTIGQLKYLQKTSRASPNKISKITQTINDMTANIEQLQTFQETENNNKEINYFDGAIKYPHKN